MIDDPGILRTLCLGLLCWAIGASLAAWKWRRQFRAAEAWIRAAKQMAATRIVAKKSLAHVKAARTRAQRERERKLAKMRELQAENHARELGW